MVVWGSQPPRTGVISYTCQADAGECVRTGFWRELSGSAAQVLPRLPRRLPITIMLADTDVRSLSRVRQDRRVRISYTGCIYGVLY